MSAVCNKYNDPDPPTISRAHNEYVEEKKRKDGVWLICPLFHAASVAEDRTNQNSHSGDDLPLWRHQFGAATPSEQDLDG